ncbi:MAG: DNA repair exonuclease [Zoogloeaceae bacterium]|nr:DNA repair exonuclease [Rhodocyclaceae bacterium]MCP5232552.1 DNA repair exonuclease [Zoogloeaceae bacterium]MCP5238680.1 DNA repair exonuclease [Zoogloeaceae bacterium]MCP5254389.1 DNA repair exonuclease [Zoogloeaceae bacterium]MCP5295829.1 DNA repair exonuclease [Zoogloeaceae bacterium]
MKFIHAADIHLDSPLVGLAAYPDAPVEMLRTATRDAFVKLIDEAIAEAVDFMVIAGDLYDGNWKDYNTGHFFCREMGRLERARIPVFLLFGNHDAESEMTRRLTLPSNVRVFDARKPTSFQLEPLRVALHGRSFKEAATTENLAVGYPPAEPGWFNIGVLHTALEGNAAHAGYAPCSLAELAARGYQYWALGHVHEFAILSEAPWVVFPGNLQGRHARETGPRGAVLVSVEDGEVIAVERLIVDVLRWQHLRVNLGGATDFEAVVRRIGQGIDGLLAQLPNHQPVALRLTLEGATAAHGALFGDAARLRAEVIGQALARGGDRLWIEKLRLDTRPPEGAGKARAEAIDDLARVLAEAPHDAALLASLGEQLRAFADKVPAELLEAVPELAAVREGRFDALLEEVSAGLLARLQDDGDAQ